MVRTSEIKPSLEENGYQFVNRTGNEITYMCIKNNHTHIRNIIDFNSLDTCETCILKEKDLLAKVISGTKWKYSDYILNYKTEFTLNCDNGHSWTGNLEQFEKRKTKDCYGCWIIYNIDQITPVTKIITDSSKIKFLRSRIEVMEYDEEGVEERKIYRVHNLLRKYKFISPLSKNDYDSDSD